MKLMLCPLLLLSHTLFTMEKSIERELKNRGVDVSKLEINPSELGHVARHHGDKKGSALVSYSARCNEGSITATIRPDKNKISCRQKIYCFADGAEGVYHQRHSEREVNAGHYHLLRILHEAQEEKKSHGK